jgi:hypothetical protein
VSEVGRPGIPTRVLVGLHYLKHAYGESDESVVARWVENPYWQYFCGDEYLQHEVPCHPTVLVKWRNRLESVGIEKMLQALLATTLRTGAPARPRAGQRGYNGAGKSHRLSDRCAALSQTVIGHEKQDHGLG